MKFSFFHELFHRKSWQEKLRDLGYKRGLDIEEMNGEIGSYDHLDNVGVGITETRSGYRAFPWYPERNGEKMLDGFEGEGKTKEDAVGNLLLSLVKEFGVRDWKGLFPEKN